jgi:hypothetical protein
MVLQEICAPALIYLVFSMTQVVIDTVKGTYNIAFIKLWVTLIFTILLNFLCNKGLGIVSWIIVFIPFILMTVIVTMILFMFGLDPITGRKNKIISSTDRKHHKHHKHHKHRKHHKPHEHHKHHNGPKYLGTKHHHNKKGQSAEYAHKFNSGYDESDISRDTRNAMNDAVTSRTGYNEDPLQKKQ